MIAAPITSGDTALRSARLIVADFLNLDQRPVVKRLMIAFPLFAMVFGMVFVDFGIVWRYFSWTNQTLAVFTLWAGTLFLYKHSRYRYGYLMALIPALFMTMVCTSYIFIAKEGLHLPAELRWIGYVVAACVTVLLLTLFVLHTQKN